MDSRLATDHPYPPDQQRQFIDVFADGQQVGDLHHRFIAQPAGLQHVGVGQVDLLAADVELRRLAERDPDDLREVPPHALFAAEPRRRRRLADAAHAVEADAVPAGRRDAGVGEGVHGGGDADPRRRLRHAGRQRAEAARADGGGWLEDVVLLDRLATPMELLEMQADGRRCVTCFCTQAELGREWVDSYAPFAVKDALHFMIHDLQHMEKFVAPAYYCEQIGFLHKMRAVYAWAKPVLFLQPENDGGGGSLLMLEDKQLRADVAHLISDMNTCSAHMLDFLLAKWWGASTRRQRQAHQRTQQQQKVRSTY